METDGEKINKKNVVLEIEKWQDLVQVDQGPRKRGGAVETFPSRGQGADRILVNADQTRRKRDGAVAGLKARAGPSLEVVVARRNNTVILALENASHGVV